MTSTKTNADDDEEFADVVWLLFWLIIAVPLCYWQNGPSPNTYYPKPH